MICPTARAASSRYEVLDGIHIYRHPLPLEAAGALGYLLEYGAALFWEFLLALAGAARARIRRRSMPATRRT